MKLDSLRDLFLTELRDNPGFWFTALREIVGYSPVPAHDRQDAAKAREAWLNWGKARGYLE